MSKITSSISPIRPSDDPMRDSEDVSRPSNDALGPSASADGAVEPSSAGSGDCTVLTMDHLWLADAIARRFRGRGVDHDDLQQVARCALLEASHRFDPSYGPFAAYASPTINGVLKRHFRDHGWVVRPPRQTQQLAVRITRQWAEIAQKNGAVPSDADLAESLDEPVDAIREARKASQGYNTVPFDTANPPWPAMAREDPGFRQCETRLEVERVWQLLDPDERDLLRMRFWDGRSQSEIAATLGISQMQVSRLLSRLLRRIREQLEDAAEEDALVRRSA